MGAGFDVPRPGTPTQALSARGRGPLGLAGASSDAKSPGAQLRDRARRRAAALPDNPQRVACKAPRWGSGRLAATAVVLSVTGSGLLHAEAIDIRTLENHFGPTVTFRPDGAPCAHQCHFALLAAEGVCVLDGVRDHALGRSEKIVPFRGHIGFRAETYQAGEAAQKRRSQNRKQEEAANGFSCGDLRPAPAARAPSRILRARQSLVAGTDARAEAWIKQRSRPVHLGGLSAVPGQICGPATRTWNCSALHGALARWEPRGPKSRKAWGVVPLGYTGQERFKRLGAWATRYPDEGLR